jgi:hypothetical protein
MIRNIWNDRVRRATLWHPFRVREFRCSESGGVAVDHRCAAVPAPGYGLASLRDEHYQVRSQAREAGQWSVAPFAKRDPDRLFGANSVAGICVIRGQSLD